MSIKKRIAKAVCAVSLSIGIMASIAPTEAFAESRGGMAYCASHGRYSVTIGSAKLYTGIQSTMTLVAGIHARQYEFTGSTGWSAGDELASQEGDAVWGVSAYPAIHTATWDCRMR